MLKSKYFCPQPICTKFTDFGKFEFEKFVTIHFIPLSPISNLALKTLFQHQMKKKHSENRKIMREKIQFN